MFFQWPKHIRTKTVIGNQLVKQVIEFVWGIGHF